MEIEDKGSFNVEAGYTVGSVSDKISSLVLTGRMSRSWLLGTAAAFTLLMLFLLAVGYLLVGGVGIWGINIPVGWGFAIINFVWWIGIGHAGTLISAILLLLRQEWRTSINRFAEAMTLFAVACAGLFPLMHLGRPALFYWLLPYPNTMNLMPQFRSPLVWDVIAVITYATVSLMFWFIGLIPDLATLRDRATNRALRVIFGFLAMGWRGSARHWKRYRQAYVWMAALATPLVISVHSIVGMDFAFGIIPGWHSTIQPPFFVAGAVLSGFAMVIVIAIPLRRFYHLEDLITARHFDMMAKFILLTGLMVGYGYLMELFMGWYSGNTFEQYLIQNHFVGPYAALYYGMLLFNVLIPQALWFPRVRRSTPLLFGVSLLVLVGMWLERFVIVSVSLSRDFLPSSWALYIPTVWDYATFIGTIGLFLTLLFLFIRFLPVISIFEMREMVVEQQEAEEGAAS